MDLHGESGRRISTIASLTGGNPASYLDLNQSRKARIESCLEAHVLGPRPLAFAGTSLRKRELVTGEAIRLRQRRKEMLRPELAALSTTRRATSYLAKETRPKSGLGSIPTQPRIARQTGAAWGKRNNSVRRCALSLHLLLAVSEFNPPLNLMASVLSKESRYRANKTW